MSSAITISGNVKNGKFSAGAKVRDIMKAHEGRYVSVTIKPSRKRRSNSQNDYYWCVVIPAIVTYAQEQGNTIDPQEMHDFLKMRVGGFRKIIRAGGEATEVPANSRFRTTTEFMDYIVKVQAWAADFGIYIPDPNET